MSEKTRFSEFWHDPKNAGPVEMDLGGLEAFVVMAMAALPNATRVAVYVTHEDFLDMLRHTNGVVGGRAAELEEAMRNIRAAMKGESS